MEHVPVLTKEVLEVLNPKPDENFVDCTVGQGGHAKLILEKTAPNGKLLGIDLDPQQISNSQWLRAKFQDRIILANDSYTNLQEIVSRKNLNPVGGILIDLGMSSWQLEGEKGFSFKLDQGLDMRYNDQANYLTAEKIVNEWPEEKIEKTLREYSEEKFSKKIAKKIIEQRKLGRIKTTFELAEIIRDATPASYWHAKIHYATRTFQALRMAVNGELDNLEKVLPQAVQILSQGGRMAIISFHSLEDRIVKNFLREKEKQGLLKILNKKPITAPSGEIKQNPRSRSAKLRAAVKI